MSTRVRSRVLLLAGLLLLMGATDGPFPFEVTRSKLKYPRDALKQKLEGFVDLRITVNQDGKVLDAQIVSSSPSGVFDQAAKDSIMQWRFAPKCAARFARTFTGLQRITFALSDKANGVESAMFSVEESHYQGPEQQRIVEQSGGGFRIEAVDPCADTH